MLRALNANIWRALERFIPPLPREIERADLARETEQELDRARAEIHILYDRLRPKNWQRVEGYDERMLDAQARRLMAAVLTDEAFETAHPDAIRDLAVILHRLVCSPTPGYGEGFRLEAGVTEEQAVVALRVKFPAVMLEAAFR